MKREVCQILPKVVEGLRVGLKNPFVALCELGIIMGLNIKIS
jgi:hypothetical protein